MDGYAVRSADIAAPATLTVIEEVAAGRVPTQTRRRRAGDADHDRGPDPGRGRRGHPARGDRSQRRIRSASAEPVRPGSGSCRAAARCGPARSSSRPGRRLTPQAFGLLAAVGRTTVRAYPAAAAGDHLDRATNWSSRPRRPGPGQIRNSNGPMLVRPGEPSRRRPPRTSASPATTAADLTRLVARGPESADVLVLSGGVSAGKFDLVPEVLRELGVEAHFHKVRMKPGKPLLFGTPRRHAGLRAARQPGQLVRRVRVVRPAGLAENGGTRDTRPGVRAGAAGRGPRRPRTTGRPMPRPGWRRTTDGLARFEPAASWFGSADPAAAVLDRRDALLSRTVPGREGPWPLTCRPAIADVPDATP